MQLLVTSRTLRSRSKAYTCHSRVHSEEDAHQPPAVTRWPSLNWALVPGPFFSTLPTPAAELHNTHEKQCVDEPPEGCKGLLNAQHLSLASTRVHTRARQIGRRCWSTGPKGSSSAPSEPADSRPLGLSLASLLLLHSMQVREAATELEAVLRLLTATEDTPDVFCCQSPGTNGNLGQYSGMPHLQGNTGIT